MRLNFSIAALVALITLDLFHCHSLKASSSSLSSSSSSSAESKKADISVAESVLSSSTSSLSPTASSPSPLVTSGASSLTSSASEPFPGLTFEPHEEPTNISSYIEALHSVPDHVFDNAAIIAAMDSDDFHRDLYTNEGGGGMSGFSPRATSATARIGEPLYAPEEMYQEEYMPLSQFDSYNFNSGSNQMKNQPTFAFASSGSGKHHQYPLMDINYNDLISGTRNMGNNYNTNNNNNRPYNGVHFISNLVPKQNGYSNNGFQPIKPTPAYNQINNQQQSRSNPAPNQQQDKNIDIDINTIRGILFQVLKHLDSQELSKNLNEAKAVATTQSTPSHQQNHHHQSTNSYVSPAKRRTNLNVYPQPYSVASGYSSSSSTNHVNHQNNNNYHSNGNKQSSYMSHVPLAYTGKPSIPSSSSSPLSSSSSSESSSGPVNSYNNPGRSSKLPNHSVGYPTTVEIVGEQGLIAIPLPPNVVKFNYFGKNLNNLNKNSNNQVIKQNKKSYQPQSQHLPQPQSSTGYYTSGSTNQVIKSNYHGSSNNLNGKNCHHHNLESSETYAASS